MKVKLTRSTTCVTEVEFDLSKENIKKIVEAGDSDFEIRTRSPEKFLAELEQEEGLRSTVFYLLTHASDVSFSLNEYFKDDETFDVYPGT